MKKTLCFTLFVSYALILFGQVTDDFADGDFTSNPAWTGDTDAFQVTGGELNTDNDPDAGGLDEYYLSTTSIAAYDASWEFFVDLQFSTSGANFVDVYLMADQSDLTSSTINGYFVRLGDTDDEIVLYKITNGSPAVIIDFGDDLFDSSSSNPFKIRVTRNTSDLWTLDYDDGNTGSFVTGGTVTDNTFDTSVAFGIYIEQSSLNGAVNGHFFDDFVVTGSALPDTDPPMINAVTAISETSIEVDFNEDIEESSAETSANYTIDGLSVIAAERDDSDNSLVSLTVSTMTNGTTYDLVVNNIEDLSNNEIATNSNESFQYIVFGTPGERDIVINEFNVDQTGSLGLPEAEFVELYNPTTDYFDLAGFVIEEEASSTSTSGSMSSFTLAPGAYVIICDNNDVADFESFGDVVGVSDYPDFNLADVSMILRDASSTIIDQVDYGSGLPTNGITYEQINPTLPCTGDFNFASSTATDGGTPGAENTVFDDTPDTTAPSFVSLEVIGPDSIQVAFDEPLEEGALEATDFNLSGFSITAVGLIDNNTVGLSLDTELVSENSYTLEFSGLEDCSGNASDSASDTFFYDITAPVLEALIVSGANSLFLVFNEPLSESVAEDEDLFTVNQSIGSPVTNTLQDTAANRIFVEFDVDFSIGTTYTLSYNSIEDTVGNVGGNEATDFSFEDKVDTVLAVAANIVEVQFSEKVTAATGTNPFNYQLEDLGNPTSVVRSSGDTYRLVFDGNMDDNTDLQLFIEGMIAKTDDEALITPAFTFRYDTDNPSITTLGASGPSELTAVFDESLDPVSATNLSFYQLDRGDFPTDASLDDNTVTLTFADDFTPEVETELTYTRIADLYGNFSTSNRTKAFTFDSLAPRLDDIFQFNDTTIAISASESLKFVDLVNSNYSVASENPESIQTFGPDSSRIHLIFEKALKSSRITSYEIANWADNQGNKLTEALTGTLDTKNPRFSELRAINDSTLRITYSKSMSTSVTKRKNYNFTGLTIEALEQINNDQFDVIFRKTLEDGTSYSLVTSDIEDASGRSLQFDSTGFAYNDFLEGITVIDTRTLDLEFETEFDDIDATQFDLSNVEIALASIDPDDAAIIRLVLSSDLPENEVFTLSWQGLIDLYDRTLPDHQEVLVIDTEAPTIEEVESGFDGMLQIEFSELLDENTLASPSQVSITNIGNPTQLSFGASGKLSSTFPSLEEGEDYELIIESFSDQSGNFQSADTLNFTYDPPEVVPVGSILINEIMIDPTPAVGLPEAEYLELINVTGTDYNLSSLRISKANDEIQLPDTTIAAGAIMAFVDESDFSDFSSFQVVQIDGLVNFSNSEDSIVLANINGEIVDRLEYTTAFYQDNTKDDGGYSLERINPQSACIGASNWSASTDPSGGTPGTTNSVFSTNPDTDSPTVLDLDVLTDDTLRMTFSEEMDPGTLNLASFSTNGPSIEAFTVDEDRLSVIQGLDEALSEGISYEMTVSGLADCSGNIMSDTLLVFGVGADPLQGDLRITEIMADPTPPLGLPETEYIEVFNLSSQLISLDDIHVGEGGGMSSPIGGNLESGAYVVLVPSANISEFSGVHVRGVSNLPSFNNNGEAIAILDGDSVVIDNVTYDLSWYQDGDKEDGGYSLELINLQSACEGIANWIASTNASGGTPGAQNSVFSNTPETTPPTVRLDFVETAGIELRFSEEMDASSIRMRSFSVSGLGIDSVIIGPGALEVEVLFETSLSQEALYDLEISGPKDCSGNVMADTTFTFGLGAAPSFREVIISEIMADPEPTVDLPNSEYLEIYNRSNRLLSLQGIRISDGSAVSSPIGGVIQPESYVLLVPTGSAALFTNIDAIEVSGLPSLNNGGEDIALISQDSTVIDNVAYEIGWYQDPAKQDGGYSLELINPDSECKGIANWIGSNNASGGTPGFINSVFSDIPERIPPLVSFQTVLDKQTIQIRFSEEMDGNSLRNRAFTSVLEVATIAVAADLQTVEIIFTNEIPNDLVNELTISGPLDCSGNALADTVLTFGIGSTPTFGEILITEIMADPEPVRGLPNSEYLEIHNRSNRLLSLSEVRIEDATGASSTIGGILKPREYQVLAPASSVPDFEGLAVRGISNWTALTNAGELIGLWHDDELIFQVEYQLSWHEPQNRDGGVALEIKDIDNPCGQSENWSSSLAEQGGTPGVANSVATTIPDNFGPSLERVVALNQDSVLLIFDEILDPTVSVSFQFDPRLEAVDSTVHIQGAEISVAVEPALTQGQEYTVIVENLADCLGNAVQSNQRAFVLPFEAGEDDILLSEILFDPRPDGFDFIEVFNQSSDFLSLEDLEIRNESSSEVISQKIIVAPNDYMVLTENRASLLLFYPNAVAENIAEIPSLPTLPNDEGTVSLYMGGVLLDSLYYEDGFHNPLLENTEGVSLERVSFDRPNNAENWASAASTIGFATPGYENSQGFDIPAFTDPVQAEPRVFVPGSGFNSFTTINYEFEQSGLFANIYLYDQNGRLIRTLGEGISLASDGFVRWDGTSDTGSVARVGYYVVVFEVFGSNGSAEIFKETIAIGRDF